MKGLKYETNSRTGYGAERGAGRSAARRKKKKSVFWILFLLYTAAITTGGICILTYVHDSLILYENSQSTVYMDALIKELQTGGELVGRLEDRYVEEASLSRFDDEWRCRRQFETKVNGAGLSFEISAQSYDTSLPVYDVFADGERFLTVSLRSVNPQTRLGIMTVSDWELLEISFPSLHSSGDKRFQYDITAPENYSIYVNDIKLGEEELFGEPKAMSEFQYVEEYVEMPKLLSYHIEGLMYEPEFVVRDASGRIVGYEVKDNGRSVEARFGDGSPEAEFPPEVDALNIAKTWSLFMTRDLSGPKYGVDQVLKFFVKDSYLYKMANRYAGGIDITFVSAHVFESFTGESVSNYIRYTDNCFSCDVYFEKNMRLTNWDSPRTDIFNSRMYFVYIEDSAVAAPGWYLADMQAIIDSRGQ